MKKIIFSTGLLLIIFTAFGQLKKDGTPDMRYKANKELYGNTYTTPTYTPSTYTSSYYTPSTYVTPNYSSTIDLNSSSYQPQIERSYNNGGQIKLQEGYFKSNGTYVAPHIKTSPDNYKWNNLKP